MLPAYFAYMFTGAIMIVVLFQFALICGAPWGHLAMGGRYPGRFPPAMRIAAFIQCVLLSLFAVVTLIRADVLGTQYANVADIAIWPVTLVSAASVIMNLATPSKWERILWVPVGTVMLVSSGWLAMHGGA